jgi:alkaline phosphatase
MAVPLGLLYGCALFMVAFWPGQILLAAQAVHSQNPPRKYVFFFLSDGGGIAHMEITRQYNRVVHDEGLTIVDRIIAEGTLGLMTTHAADSLSTDSAAAATALAGGCKANIGALGVCADGTVATSVMEIARQRGMRLGLVTNSTIYDASPAAFVCHVPSRRDYGAILNRYLDLEPHVLLGGGKDQFLPKERPGGKRTDNVDMIAAFSKKGYAQVSDKRGLEQTRGSKVLGLFSDSDMSFEIDRNQAIEPSVYDMTQATIRLLHENNPSGFFAFIENENIDTASHLSDIAALVRDYREFDRSVGLAYEFYRKYPKETLIIVTSDHETGGLGFTLALKDLSSTRGSNQVAGTMADLKKISTIPISLRRAAEILGPNPTAEAVDRLMQEQFKGFTLAPDLKEALLTRRPLSRTVFGEPTANALGMMVANNTQAYWQTTAHTNHPVFVAALGNGAERFKGYFDNADFGKTLKVILQGSTTSPGVAAVQPLAPAAPFKVPGSKSDVAGSVINAKP